MSHVRDVADYDLLLGQQEFTSESKSAGEDVFIDASLKPWAHIFNALHHHVTPVLMHYTDIK